MTTAICKCSLSNTRESENPVKKDKMKLCENTNVNRWATIFQNILSFIGQVNNRSRTSTFFHTLVALYLAFRINLSRLMTASRNSPNGNVQGGAGLKTVQYGTSTSSCCANKTG